MKTAKTTSMKRKLDGAAVQHGHHLQHASSRAHATSDPLLLSLVTPAVACSLTLRSKLPSSCFYSLEVWQDGSVS